MQEEVRVSLELSHQSFDKFEEPAPLDSHQEETFKKIIGVFEEYIEIIKKNPKMDKYLDEISINSKELIQNFQNTIKIFKELNIKSQKNKNTYFTFRGVWQHILTFLTAKNLQKLDTKGKTVWLIQVDTKLGVSASLMNDMKTVGDITNSPKELFSQVWQKITIVPPKNMKSLMQDIKKTKKMLHVTASAVLSQQTHDFYLTRVVSFGLSFPQYMIMNDSAKLQSFKFYRNPTIEIAQKFWNLPEQGATKEFIKAVYKGIKTNRKIYLPPNGEVNNRTNILVQNPQCITVRILYSKKLHIFAQGQSICCCVSDDKQKQLDKQPQFIDTVLIHMHGGGFIALSSRSTQAYTRKWANQLNVPIFSVDYRMPPTHPFPQAPQDCFAVYNFLIKHVHKFMNVKPTNIYISGDSAGGNLACSLTGLILKNKLPAPKGIYIAYPAVDLRLNFTLSRVFSLTDVLLWPSVLLLCLNSYLNKDFSLAEDPTASPLLLTQEFVNGAPGDRRFPRNWPRTIVTIGNKDPLFDDSLILMQKMVESKIQCECFIYEGLSHGYLSTQMLIQQTGRTIVDSIIHLKKLMGIEDSKKPK